jgi:hypothetical protein
MPTVNELTNITNGLIDSTGNTIINAFNTMSDALNAGGDFVTFGSTDRRQGYLGLILGPIYDAVWQNLSVIITTMLGMEIGDYCNFNDRMYGYMTRLMLINLWEHNTTLAMLCESGSNQANANSQTITHEAQIPPYTKGNNYLENVRNIIAYEPAGQHATNIDIQDGPYKKNNNLFPDDNDQRAEEFTNGDVWSVSDPNSILYKTKCLFRQRKIKSLISRFGTNSDANPKETRIPEEGNARTKFGLSHGRNLLTKNAEDNGISYAKNGYNNPYCRVWTHHYQYDKYNKTMRPFENTRKNLDKSHNWGERFKEEDKEKGAWKDGARWEKTVLNGRGDGLINITPHFSGGGKKNIHSKDCMFSIENLAWKDYDPYSFEKALSWEQRGPLGGRIMWFPPYGLTFNETSQAQWNANTFIGRGEDVYTYVNTKRTGTLQFYLIVDHPSILDYVSWYEANRERVKDTDILRYFAGCDPNDVDNSDSLLHYVQPTPLTDEGARAYKKGDIKKEWKPKDIPPAAKPEQVKFIVYFPNNYSGMFDVDSIKNDKEGTSGLGADFVVKYLLAGSNAQQKTDLRNDSIRIQMENSLDKVEKMTGPGYEMEGESGITIDDGDKSEEIEKIYNGIVGNDYQWVVPDEGQSAKKYNPNTNKIWRYRIDGTFKVPVNDSGHLNNIYSNTYAQTPAATSYKDKSNYHLNSSLSQQKINYGGTIPDDAYTFTEVVEAVAKVSQNSVINSFFKDTDRGKNINDDERVEKLVKLFSDSMDQKTKLKLQSITFQGFANSQGNNENEDINTIRNKILAKGRAETISKWLTGAISEWKDVTCDFKGNEVINVTVKSADSLNAKLYRATKCTLSFLQEATVDATETEEIDSDTEKFVKLENQKFAGKDLYKLVNDDGSKWIKLEDGTLAKINEDSIDYSDEQFWLDVMDGKYEAWEVDAMKYDTGPSGEDSFNNYSLFNKVRYDQEYHFFRRVKEETPLIYKKLMDKIKYFDPAFHSMTPEGFNARCTFLNQCTRQGNTVGVSDTNRLSASNMAFGRPPFCVLRLGDFYNQLIVIDNVNIQYDTSGGVVWDLNDEGVGVQPMLAQVSLNFTFIGGGSLDGPVRRLQNAMSFAYYSNTELYDNRADRAVYDYDINLTMGGAGKGQMNLDESKFHSVEMYDPEKLN